MEFREELYHLTFILTLTLPGLVKSEDSADSAVDAELVLHLNLGWGYYNGYSMITAHSQCLTYM